MPEIFKEAATTKASAMEARAFDRLLARCPEGCHQGCSYNSNINHHYGCRLQGFHFWEDRSGGSWRLPWLRRLSIWSQSCSSRRKEVPHERGCIISFFVKEIIMSFFKSICQCFLSQVWSLCHLQFYFGFKMFGLGLLRMLSFVVTTFMYSKPFSHYYSIKYFYILTI